MAFVVQDENGSVAATAYISVAEFIAYHADRGNDHAAYDTDAIERAIIRATDFIDGRYSFSGTKTSTSQRTAWPRIDAYDSDDNFIEGLPTEVKEACAELAFIALSSSLNPTPVRDSTGRTVQAKASSVGPISESVTYADGAGFAPPEYPVADAKLGRLAVGGGTIRRG